MVSPVSKLANPWKCDAPGCGILRAKDTNHWLIVRFRGPHSNNGLGNPEVIASPWDDELAELLCVKHVCGIDCGLKVIAQMIDEHFFGNAEKERSHDGGN